MSPAALEEAPLEAVCAKVCLGGISRVRQLLTSPGIAPGAAEALAELRSPDLRPPQLTADIVLDFRPASRLELNRAKRSLFCPIRSARICCRFVRHPA